MTGLTGRRPRVKISTDERMRRLRLGDLRRLLRDRCRGSILPDDDAGRDYLRELLLPISLGPHEAVTLRNSWTVTPGRIRAWQRSIRDFVRLAASIVNNGICRQNQNG